MVQQVALLASVGYLGFAARGLRGVARMYGADQAWRENHESKDCFSQKQWETAKIAAVTASNIF